MRALIQRSRLLQWATSGVVFSLVLTACASVSPEAGTARASTTSVTGQSSTVTYNDTCERTANSQSALNECVDHELSELNTQLSDALLTEAGRFGQHSVAAAQSQWVKYRDAECALEASPNRGGSIYPLIYGICERSLIIARIGVVRDAIAAHSQ